MFFSFLIHTQAFYYPGIIRFAHEPFVGGLQIISNLRNFVAGFFFPHAHLSFLLSWDYSLCS
jgi:hypothetical protein